MLNDFVLAGIGAVVGVVRTMLSARVTHIFVALINLILIIQMSHLRSVFE